MSALLDTIGLAQGDELLGARRIGDRVRLTAVVALGALAGCQSLAGLTDRSESPGSSGREEQRAAASEPSAGAAGASESGGASESVDETGEPSGRAQRSTGGGSSLGSEGGAGTQRESASGGNSTRSVSGQGGTGGITFPGTGGEGEVPGTGGAAAQPGTGGAVVLGTGGDTVHLGTGGDAPPLPVGGAAAGGAAAGGGAAGSGGDVELKDCANKTVITRAEIADFEDYDGTLPVDSWLFSFNAAPEDEHAVLVEPFGFGDEDGTFSCAMTEGNLSRYALGISDTEATTWGAGIGLAMSCVDASRYTGIALSVRGTAPMGTALLMLMVQETLLPECTGTGVGIECIGPSIEFDVTDAWTPIRLPFAGFTEGTAAAGVAVPATGDNIEGFAISVVLEWGEDEANPGEFIFLPAPVELVIDDVSFY
ncbi:MAG: hypothetical protein JW940_29295 [Polyangiaceae bacterium]|nr:hypothetical protein [Polyangiaceae bacterium]